MKRLTLNLLAAAALAACGGNDGDGGSGSGSALQSVDETKLISSAEAKEWLEKKDEFNPSYTGSEKWKAYLTFLEDKLRSYGAVDFTRYTFPYARWHTTESSMRKTWAVWSNQCGRPDLRPSGLSTARFLRRIPCSTPSPDPDLKKMSVSTTSKSDACPCCVPEGALC
jgi:hypothetical protein